MYKHLIFILLILSLIVPPVFADSDDPYKELLERFEEDLHIREELLKESFKTIKRLEAISIDVTRSISEDVERVRKEHELHHEREMMNKGNFYHPKEHNFSKRMEDILTREKRLRERADTLQASLEDIDKRSSVIANQIIERITDSRNDNRNVVVSTRFNDYSSRVSVIERALEQAETRVTRLERERDMLVNKTADRYDEFIDVLVDD